MRRRNQLLQDCICMQKMQENTLWEMQNSHWWKTIVQQMFWRGNLVEFLRCKTCDSIKQLNQINGRCRVCKKRTCADCTRKCSQCQIIVCMFHASSVEIKYQKSQTRETVCIYCKKILDNDIRHGRFAMGFLWISWD